MPDPERCQHCEKKKFAIHTYTYRAPDGEAERVTLVLCERHYKQATGRKK